mgnify:CR=1 FL=1
MHHAEGVSPPPRMPPGHDALLVAGHHLAHEERPPTSFISQALHEHRVRLLQQHVPHTSFPRQDIPEEMHRWKRRDDNGLAVVFGTRRSTGAPPPDPLGRAVSPFRRNPNEPLQEFFKSTVCEAVKRHVGPETSEMLFPPVPYVHLGGRAGGPPASGVPPHPSGALEIPNAPIGMPPPLGSFAPSRPHGPTSSLPLDAAAHYHQRAEGAGLPLPPPPQLSPSTHVWLDRAARGFTVTPRPSPPQAAAARIEPANRLPTADAESTTLRRQPPAGTQEDVDGRRAKRNTPPLPTERNSGGSGRTSPRPMSVVSSVDMTHASRSATTPPRYAAPLDRPNGVSPLRRTESVSPSKRPPWRATLLTTSSTQAHERRFGQDGSRSHHVSLSPQSQVVHQTRAEFASEERKQLVLQRAAAAQRTLWGVPPPPMSPDVPPPSALAVASSWPSMRTPALPEGLPEPSSSAAHAAPVASVAGIISPVAGTTPRAPVPMATKSTLTDPHQPHAEESNGVRYTKVDATSPVPTGVNHWGRDSPPPQTNVPTSAPERRRTGAASETSDARRDGPSTSAVASSHLLHPNEPPAPHITTVSHEQLPASVAERNAMLLNALRTEHAQRTVDSNGGARSSASAPPGPWGRTQGALVIANADAHPAASALLEPNAPREGTRRGPEPDEQKALLRTVKSPPRRTSPKPARRQHVSYEAEAAAPPRPQPLPPSPTPLARDGASTSPPRSATRATVNSPPSSTVVHPRSLLALLRAETTIRAKTSWEEMDSRSFLRDRYVEWLISERSARRQRSLSADRGSAAAAAIVSRPLMLRDVRPSPPRDGIRGSHWWS